MDERIDGQEAAQVARQVTLWSAKNAQDMLGNDTTDFPRYKGGGDEVDGLNMGRVLGDVNITSPSNSGNSGGALSTIAKLALGAALVGSGAGLGPLLVSLLNGEEVQQQEFTDTDTRSVLEVTIE